MSLLNRLSSGINILTGFKLHSPLPLDIRQNVSTIEERDSLVSDNIVFKGIRVFVEETKKSYIYNGESWDEIPSVTSISAAMSEFTGTNGENSGEKGLVPAPTSEDINKFLGSNGLWNSLPVVSETTSGIMTSKLLTKLNGIAEGANNYTHPETHDATIITEDESHRFVSDTEKETWNNKIDFVIASAAPSTISRNGIFGAIIDTAIKYNDPLYSYGGEPDAGGTII